MDIGQDSFFCINLGRGGETIRSICKASGAKITCDKESEGTLLLSRLIKISGTQKEVAAAKASIPRMRVALLPTLLSGYTEMTLISHSI